MTNLYTDHLPTRRGVPIHALNPFLHTTTINTKKRSLTVAKGSVVLNADTGEEEGTTTIAQVKNVDSEKFVKLFSGSIKAYFDLNAPGTKMFSVLLSAVQEAPNTDRIYINHRVAQAAFKLLGKTLSEAVFHRGMKELVEKSIIAHTQDPGWIFINPAIIFNGDRARFLLDLRKTKSSTKTRMRSDDGQILLPLDGETRLPNDDYMAFLQAHDEGDEAEKDLWEKSGLLGKAPSLPDRE